MIRRCMASFVVLSLAAVPASADVRLARIFTDNMMVQRDRPVRLWGWAEPGEQVEATLAGKTGAAKADEKGRWLVELPAVHEGENLEIVVAGRNRLVLRNIIVGDIWLCSGQSNMAWPMSLSDASADIKAADLPRIRRLKLTHVSSFKPVDDPVTEGGWQVCTPLTAAGFSGVGFAFARDVLGKTDVPIGLLESNWGGTGIEPWTSLEGMEAEPELAAEATVRRTAVEAWLVKMSQYVADLERWLATAPHDLTGARADSPVPAMPAHPGAIGWGSIYHAMIHPLVRLPIKGVLWYQGEANGAEGELYRHKMQALVDGWRKAWSQPDLPFYFVQLASWKKPTDAPAGDDGWARLREAQRHALGIPHTGMAVAIDTVPLAAADDVHPRNKYDIGLRLARWALRNEYGQPSLVPSGPLFKSLRIDGGKAVIEFDHVGSGLMVAAKQGREPAVEETGGTLRRFAIAGADRKWVWAEAVIDGSTVVVSSPEVPIPVAVRYAFSMNPHGANLYNREGLPASPFRTDDW